MKENIYFKKKYAKYIILFFLFTFPIIGETIENNKINLFFKASTEEARNQLKYFKNTELLDVWNEYKKSKTIEEQRNLWLIEEYYMRESDRIASDRLSYLFLAVLLLLSFIFTTLIFIYKKQDNISKKLE